MRTVLFLLAFGLLTGPLLASRQEDSTRAVVEGSVTTAERALALLTIASANASKQPGESLRKVEMALAYAERSGDQKLLLRALRQRRDLEYTAGAFDEFLVSAIRIVDLSENSSTPRELATDLHFLCEGYERIGDLEKAIDTRKQVLFLLKGTDDSAAIGEGIIGLMNSLVLAGRHQELLQQSRDAESYYSAHHDTLGTARLLLLEGEALTAQNRPSEAIPLLLRSTNALRSLKDQDHILRAMLSLAEAYVEANDWANASNALDEATSVAATSHRIDPKLYALRGRVHEGSGELADALRMHRAYVALKDSLFDLRMAERLIGLQALYNDSRRTQEIAQLQADIVVHEDLVDSVRANARWWITGTVALLFVIGALVLMTRRMRRLVRRTHLKNQVILRQTEEIRSKNMELERQNFRLTESLVNEEEKDVQLKEIHHRVKNNLQIVNTLLKMQGTYVQDDRLHVVLSDCQGRVRSMAMVHEHIYRCGDLLRINVKAHLAALGDAILKHYSLAERVRLDLTVNYDHADLDNLIPLSLLLNELITNAAKHAFPDGMDGRITIILRRLGDSQCELVFGDNGMGLRRSDFFEKESFGLELVRTLATQLDGRIKLLKGEGTTFQMTFEAPQQALRKAS